MFVFLWCDPRRRAFAAFRGTIVRIEFACERLLQGEAFDRIDVSRVGGLLNCALVGLGRRLLVSFTRR